MRNINSQLEKVNWEAITSNLNTNGYAIIPKILSESECQKLIDNYYNPIGYRKTVVMERYRFGLGEYKYFDYPLPEIIQTIREHTYPYLVPIVNLWMKALKVGKTFPKSHKNFQLQCLNNNQLKATPLILKYSKGGFNTLHQDLYGDIYFPLQSAIFLNEPAKEYTGGEFVLTQQTPRAQSKAIVLQPKKGDMLIFATNFRPVKGVKGYYRVNMKHGVSEVREGNRHTLGIIYHDALS